MTFLNRTSKSTCQPKNYTKINYNNKLYPDFAFNAAFGNILFGKKTYIATSNVSGSTRINKYYAYKAVRATNSGIDFGTIQPISGDIWTVLVLANPNSTDGVSCLFSQRNGSSPYNQIDFSVNAAGGLTTSQGRLCATCLDTNTLSRETWTNASSYIDGNYRIYAVTSSGSTSNKKLYVDGNYLSVEGQNTTGNTTSINTGMKVRIGNIGDYSADSSYAASCDIPLVLLWNRELSDLEIQNLSKNPWQIFQASRRNLYFSLSGSGITLTGISSTYSYGSFSISTDKILDGNYSTSSQGLIIPGIDIVTTGQQFISSQGNVVSNLDLYATGQESTSSQGSLFAYLSVTATGQQFTVEQGSLSPSLSIALSGLSSASAYGILTPQTDGSITLIGIEFSSALGTLISDSTVSISGQSNSFSQGSLVSDISKALTGNESSITFGSLSPSLSAVLSGISSSLANGTLTPVVDGTITLVGLSISSAQGLFSVDLSKSVAGLESTFLQGSLSSDFQSGLSGNSITLSKGDFTISNTVGLSGNEITALQGDVVFTLRDITLTLTGQAIMSSIGSLITNDLLLDTGTQTVIICEGGSRVYIVESVSVICVESKNTIVNL